MARASRWLLAVVLAGAALLRLIGIDFGLPFPYAAIDERIVTDRVAGFLTGDLDPHYFAYPSLCFELHGVVGFARYVVGRIGGEWTTLAQFRERCWLEPGILLLPSRWLTALLAIATVWAASRAACEVARVAGSGSRAMRRTAAVVGALAVATCFLHVSNSRTITVDIPCVLFGALALAHSLRHTRTLRRRDLVMAALHAGLAGSSKYYGALFALPVAAAAIVAATRAARAAGGGALRAGVRSLALAGATTLAAFLLTSPYVVLDWPAFARDFAFLEHHVEGGHYGHDPTGNGALVYGRRLWSELVGPPLLLAAALGALLLLASRRRPGNPGTALVLLLQPPLHFALIASFKAQPPDYLLPLLPALAAAAGAGIAVLASRLAAIRRAGGNVRDGAHAAEAVLAGLFALPLLIGGGRGLQEGLELRRPDSHVLLREWAARRWPDATKVASDSWLELPLTLACIEQIAADRASGATIPIRRGPDWPDEQLAALLAASRRAPPAVGVDFLLLLPRELDLGEGLVRTLRENGFRWLVLDGVHAARTRRISAQFPARTALYDRLSSGPWVVARFPDPPDSGSGPELVVVDLDLVARR
jgi:dolichyl-phosphate-mannose-protein mannosyltransferase